MRINIFNFHVYLFSFSESAETDVSKKYPLLRVRGFPFPEPFFLINNIEDTIDFKPQDSDIFVVTYPKCGTTWMQYIVWEILHKGAVPPPPNRMMFEEFPFLEATGIKILGDMSPPRTMKTHLPFSLQPYNPKAKYIYVVRNPWDCCVSYYHHHQFDPSMPKLTFDEYFELFIRGEVGWGDFFDHILSWYEHRNDPNILFITYEYMKKEKTKSLLGIAKFLGDSYHEDLNSNQEIQENCLIHSDFKYMKDLGMFFPKGGSEDFDPNNFVEVMKTLSQIDRSTADPEKFEEVHFFRKGAIGDWKNYFSPSQIQKFNDYMLRKLKDTEMENFWKPQMEETTL